MKVYSDNVITREELDEMKRGIRMNESMLKLYMVMTWINLIALIGGIAFYLLW